MLLVAFGNDDGHHYCRPAPGYPVREPQQIVDGETFYDVAAAQNDNVVASFGFVRLEDAPGYGISHGTATVDFITRKVGNLNPIVNHDFCLRYTTAFFAATS